MRSVCDAYPPSSLRGRVPSTYLQEVYLFRLEAQRRDPPSESTRPNSPFEKNNPPKLASGLSVLIFSLHSLLKKLYAHSARFLPSFSFCDLSRLFSVERRSHGSGKTRHTRGRGRKTYLGLRVVLRHLMGCDNESDSERRGGGTRGGEKAYSEELI